MWIKGGKMLVMDNHASFILVYYALPMESKIPDLEECEIICQGLCEAHPSLSLIGPPRDPTPSCLTSLYLVATVFCIYQGSHTTQTPTPAIHLHVPKSLIYPCSPSSPAFANSFLSSCSTQGGSLGFPTHPSDPASAPTSLTQTGLFALSSG